MLLFSCELYLLFKSMFFTINWPHHWGLFDLAMMHKVLLSPNPNMCTLCFFLVCVCVPKNKGIHTYFTNNFTAYYIYDISRIWFRNLCSSKRIFEQFAMETKEIKFWLWILLTCNNLITTICSHDTICHTTICCPNSNYKCSLISWNMVKN
jgi:hypothetical protein